MNFCINLLNQANLCSRIGKIFELNLNIFFSFEDEKNQIITTNCWLNQVRLLFYGRVWCVPLELNLFCAANPGVKYFSQIVFRNLDLNSVKSVIYSRFTVDLHRNWQNNNEQLKERRIRKSVLQSKALIESIINVD